jgi:hypothetical protein
VSPTPVGQRVRLFGWSNRDLFDNAMAESFFAKGGCIQVWVTDRPQKSSKNGL